MRPRSGCRTLSSDIFFARRSRSHHQSLSGLIRVLTLPDCEWIQMSNVRRGLRVFWDLVIFGNESCIHALVNNRSCHTLFNCLPFRTCFLGRATFRGGTDINTELFVLISESCLIHRNILKDISARSPPVEVQGSQLDYREWVLSCLRYIEF